MQIILINGEAGVGKTTFAKTLSNALAGQKNCYLFSIKEPLKRMLFSLAEVTQRARYDFRDEETYAVLKNSMFAGQTGREWMIRWGTAMREFDTRVFINLLCDRIDAIPGRRQDTVILVDDLGFLNEYEEMIDYCSLLTNQPAKLSVIYLDARATRKYKPGDVFINDSRKCLSDISDFVNPTPQYLAERILRLAA